MARLNHAKLAHVGRPTERACLSGREIHAMRFQPARAATPGRSLGAAEIARVAAELGVCVRTPAKGR